MNIYELLEGGMEYISYAFEDTEIRIQPIQSTVTVQVGEDVSAPYRNDLGGLRDALRSMPPTATGELLLKRIDVVIATLKGTIIEYLPTPTVKALTDGCGYIAPNLVLEDYYLNSYGSRVPLEDPEAVGALLKAVFE